MRCVLRAKDNYKKTDDSSIYWEPVGGNNIDQMSGNCHIYTCPQKGENGEVVERSIIVDLGRFDNFEAIGVEGAEAAVPDLRNVLQKKGEKKNPNAAQGVFITHSHTDHMQGIIHYIEMGYELPTIYAGKYSVSMIKQALAAANVPINDWPKFRKIDAGKVKKIAGMRVEAVAMSHSVIDNFGFHIKSQDTSILHTGDWKIDQTVGMGKATDLKRLREIGKSGVDLMVSDNTTAMLDGVAKPEKEIEETYDEIFARAGDKKVVVAIGGGHLNRFATIANAAKKVGKKLVFAGTKYQKNHIQGFRQAGYDFKKETGCECYYSDDEGSRKLKESEKVYITTGNYGEADNPLRDALKGERSDFSVDKKTLVIVETRRELEDIFHLVRKMGADLVTGKDYEGIIGSGHALFDDFKKMCSVVKPKNIMSTHCTRDGAKNLAKKAMKRGIYVHPTAPFNGNVFKVKSGGNIELVFEKAPCWIGVKSNGEKKTGIPVVQIPTKGRGNWPMKISGARKHLRKLERREMKKSVRKYDKNTQSSKAFMKALCKSAVR
jgi:ribonuclease J